MIAGGATLGTQKVLLKTTTRKDYFLNNLDP